MDVYGTNPDYMAIDKRFRKTANNIIITGNREPRSKQDFIYYEFNRRKHTKTVKRLYYSFAEKNLFPLFNTDEIINSYNSGLNEFKLAKQNEKLFKRVLLEKIKIVKSNGLDIKTMTHDSLNDYLIDLEINLNWQKYIYNRLKRELKK